MSGNVWDWCLTDLLKPGSDAIREDLHSHTARVLRGGAWYSNQSDSRVVYRHGSEPLVRDNVFGFRLVTLSPIR